MNKAKYMLLNGGCKNCKSYEEEQHYREEADRMDTYSFCLNLDNPDVIVGGAPRVIGAPRSKICLSLDNNDIEASKSGCPFWKMKE